MRLAILSAILSVAVLLTKAQDSSIATVEEAFVAANIPSDLHITFSPTALLEVTFPQLDGSNVEVQAGAQVPQSATFFPPKFAVRGNFTPSDVFVISAVDPDALTPQNPNLAQLRHFLGGGFVQADNCSSAQNDLVEKNVTLSPWIQPSPPPGSDPHRYIFLLWHQPAGFNEQPETILVPLTPIIKFNISAFAEATGLGNPVAGTFMLVAPGL